jgi:hypothetical protein
MYGTTQNIRPWSGQVVMRLNLDPWMMCVGLTGISLSPNQLHAYWDIDNCDMEILETDFEELFKVGDIYDLQLNWQSDLFEVPVISAHLQSIQLAHHRNSLTFEFLRPCLEVDDYFQNQQTGEQPI